MTIDLSTMWEVARWSGRQFDEWGVKYQGYDEAKARNVYGRERLKLRQGAVELRCGATVVLRTTAPRLRRYW